MRPAKAIIRAYRCDRYAAVTEHCYHECYRSCPNMCKHTSTDAWVEIITQTAHHTASPLTNGASLVYIDAIAEDIL